MAQKYLYTENTVTTASQSLLVPGTVIVEADAFIIPAGGDGFDLAPGAWTFQLNGMIDATASGIMFDQNVASLSKNSLITVGSEGVVLGGGAGINAWVPVNITNSGLIGGGTFGIIAQAFGPTTSKGFTITNNKSGEIVGDAGIYNNNIDQIMTVKNQGTIASIVAGDRAIEWDGSAIITNTGEIDGDLIVLSGALPSSITNGGTIQGDITGMNGNETVKNSGLITGNIALSDGDNLLTNSGTLSGNLTLGAGNDVVNNTGTITGKIALSDGDNLLTNSGTLSFSLTGGAGNDVVNSTGTITGVVFLAGGNNTFTGGIHSEQVVDGVGGKDIYKLGGGNDILSVTTFTDNVCDGGAGVDTFNGFTSFDPVAINLDSKAATLDGQTLLAATASIKGSLSGSAIKGFEIVNGSDGADLIVGSKGADTLSGGGGKDFVAGGLGADTLAGGFADDTFVLFQVKDSGKTVATRDAITDFEGAGVAGGDTIDVSAIDTNTKQAGDQGFAWIGYNAAFDHDTGFGELRAFTVNGDTIIEGDANGDGKTDFSIAILGVTGIKDGDFAL